MSQTADIHAAGVCENTRLYFSCGGARMAPVFLAVGAEGVRVAKGIVLSACAGIPTSSEARPLDQLVIVAVSQESSAQQTEDLEQLISAYTIASGVVQHPASFHTQFQLIHTSVHAEMPDILPSESRLLQALAGFGGSESDYLKELLRYAVWITSGQAKASLPECLQTAPEVCVCGSATNALASALFRFLPEASACRRLTGVLVMPSGCEPSRSDRELAIGQDTLQSAAKLDRLDVIGLPAGDWGAESSGSMLLSFFASVSAAAALTESEDGTHFWQLPVSGLKWEDLGSRGVMLRQSWGRFFRAGAVLRIHLLQMLQARIDAKNRGIGLQLSSDAVWFRKLGQKDAAWWDQQESRLQALSVCCRKAFEAASALLAAMPGRLKLSGNEESEQEEAGQSYRALAEAIAELHSLEEQQKHLQETEGSVVQRDPELITSLDIIADRIQKQQALVNSRETAHAIWREKIGGQREIQLIRQIMTGLRQAVGREEPLLAEKRHLADQALTYPEERQNSSAIDQLFQECARLESHITHLGRLEAVLSEDLKRLYAEEAGKRQAAGPVEAGQPEMNGFFDESFLNSLIRLTDKRAQRRDVSHRLIRSYPYMVCGTVQPSISQVMKALNRAGRGSEHDDPICDCISALMGIVEEVKA